MAVGLVTVLAVVGTGGIAGASARRKLPQCVVPKLAGDTLSTARRRITAAHCTLGTVIEPQVENGQTLIVSTTNPKAGRREKNRARVAATLKIKKPVTPVAPAPIQTLLETTVVVQGNYEAATPDQASYLQVNATLTYSTSSEPLLYLDGQPIAYQIVDLDTNQTLATFAGTTGTNSTYCAIGTSIDFPNPTAETLTGESITPSVGAATVPGCALGTITFPYADTVVLQASFAGNSAYAAASDSSPSVL